MIGSLKFFYKTEVYNFCIQAFKRQEHDSEIGRIRRSDIFVADIFSTQFYTADKIFLCIFNRCLIPCIVCIKQLFVCISRKFGVNWQIYAFALCTSRKFDGIFNSFPAALNRCNFRIILFRSKYFFKNASQLNLAENTSCLDITEYTFKVAYSRSN